MRSNLLRTVRQGHTRLMLLAVASVVVIGTVSEAVATSPLERALSAAFMFRQHAADDLPGALSMFAYEAEPARWESALRPVLPDDDHAFHFFNGSYVLLGPQTGTTAVVGFYHLWSDVLLLACFDTAGAPRLVGLGWSWLAAQASPWDALAPDFTGRAWSAAARAEQVVRATQPWVGQLQQPPQQSADLTGLRGRISAHIQRTTTPPAGLDTALDRVGGEAVADVLQRSAEGRLMELPAEVFGTPAQQAEMRSWYARPQSRMIGWQPAILSLTSTRGAVVLANSIDPAEMLWIGIVTGGGAAQVGGVRLLSLRDAGSVPAPSPPSIVVLSPTPPGTAPPPLPAPPTGPIAEAPANMTGHRAMVGQTLRFRLTGSTAGGVWGSGNVYTDDSCIATAAVHHGIVRAGEQAVVVVTVLPGRDSYRGSTQNGVTTRDYGRWPGSFGFVGGPDAPAVVSLPTSPVAGTPVVARALVNGEPVGIATAFDAVPEVVLFHRFENERVGEVEGFWMRDGTEIARSSTRIQGTNGSVWFTLRAREGQVLRSGRYRAGLIMPGSAATYVDFTIGEAAAGTGQATSVIGAARVQVTTPGDGQQIGNKLTIRGTAQPGSAVRVTVSNWYRIIAEGYATLHVKDLTADAAGNWATEELDMRVPLFGMARSYRIKAEQLRPDREPAAEHTVEVKSGG